MPNNQNNESILMLSNSELLISDSSVDETKKEAGM